ncbi:MAG: hypothetical protein COT33_03440 [Candidatus Nealsonbacteria bacterium CG08_land_8_20_14_0_20_38_20]|uniref:Fimbrial assembly protein n=1 Tax=Candidatus Nealsonbacteria bacterium CG08_land_8_20_14_0_20_38_20 TaxID=1974705 RepID=A0A2H0YKX4_9BACT|nr:MAG: hypothetical protein COT33_03440 [Candidatus Nealsonbacteria bacterium CG08_land_8_20_14_0_20_38_20]
MINLLPLKYKEALRREENLRLVLIMEIIFGAFLIALALILFTIKIHIGGAVERRQIFVELKNKELSRVKPIEENLNLVNKKVEGLESFYQNQFDLTDFLGRISELLPDAVYLNSFSFQKENWKINLSGFAPTVEKLLEFKNNLEKQKGFKEVYFPAAIWLQSADINFDMSFLIAPEEYGRK